MKLCAYCNDSSKPVGVDETPWFSWVYKPDGGDGLIESQSSWRIRVYSDENHDCVWDSGKVSGDTHTHVLYSGKQLRSMSRYTWKVSVTCGALFFESEAQSFATGVLNDADWGAHWIESSDNTINSPIMKYTFTLTSEQAQSGLACICGLGYYEMYLNGVKVTDERLTPARTDYARVVYKNLQYPFRGNTRKSALFGTYDLTGFLRSGMNTVTVWLGNGFYRQNVRGVEGTLYYGAPSLLFRMECGDAVIVSNENWLVADSPIRHDNPYDGEVYDERLLPTDMFRSNSDALVWQNACRIGWKETRLLGQLCPADYVQQTIKMTPLGGDFYDAGETLCGVIRVGCRGERGATVRIYYAEAMRDGKPDYTSTCGYTDQDREQIQTDTYILRGEGIEDYCPRFARHGFRYVYVETDHAEVMRVEALRIGMDLAVSSALNCSNGFIAKLHTACVNTLRSNLSGGVLTDNPTRERLGYTGDGHIVCDAVMTAFDAHTFYRKWINDIIDAQDGETGFVPHTAPFTGGGGGPVWGCAIAIVPWMNYIHYNDTATLKKTLAPMSRWIDYLSSRLDERGLVSFEELGSWCLGDWAFPSDREWSEPQLEQPLKPEFVNTCYYLHCINLYRQACLVLDAPFSGRFEKAAADAAKAINARYYRNGGYLDGIQGADAFALMANAVPARQIATVRGHLADYYEKRAYKIDTGMFGTPLVLEELRKAGRCDVAWRILARKGYPGYQHLLELSPSTICETWEGSGSHNQSMYSSVDAWLYKALGGIVPHESEGGYRVFDVAPYYPEDVSRFDASMNTPQGRIAVAWQKSESTVELSVEVPFGARALVRLSDCERQAVSYGKHDFIIKI